MGASFSLPLLDAMVPAGRAWKDVTKEIGQFTRLRMHRGVHGVRGRERLGRCAQSLRPGGCGTRLRAPCRTTSSSRSKAYREYLTIVSNTDCRMAEPYRAEEIGGDHDRSTAVFLTTGASRSRRRARTSSSERRSTRSTRGGLRAGAPRCLRSRCASRASTGGVGAPTTTTVRTRLRSPGRLRHQPLPAIREPRAVFERLFGAGDSRRPIGCRAGAGRTASVLDWIVEEVATAEDARWGPVDRVAMDEYLARTSASWSGGFSSWRQRNRERARSARCRKHRPAFPIRSKSTCS